MYRSRLKPKLLPPSHGKGGGAKESSIKIWRALSVEFIFFVGQQRHAGCWVRGQATRVVLAASAWRLSCAANVGEQRAANMSRAVQYEEDAFCFLLPRIRATCKAGQTFCSPAAYCLYVHY